jgi:transcriptional regulator with XRE-family HTH domain
MDYQIVNNAEIKNIISSNIKRFAKKSKKTRHEICEELKIKYSTFCDWINGNSSPKPEALYSMSHYFGVSIDDFFIEYQQENDMADRVYAYANEVMSLSSRTMETLSEDQIREMLKRGFSLKHKTLEERVAEFEGKLTLDGEYDWGGPVGREVW